MIITLLIKVFKNLNASNSKNIFQLIVIASILFGANTLKAQDNYILTHSDSLALESVIVEKYYISDSTDYSNTTNTLPKGSVTYRIYIDMKPDYTLQLVYGDEKHKLFIKTSTTFFNNKDCYAYTGFNVDALKINENTFALDSWITMGAATRLHTGVLKIEDIDGSIITRNTLTKADGLTKGNLPLLKIFNLDLGCFNKEKDASEFSSINGGWGALGGVTGPTVENRVLIAQITTNGNLSFNLNIQLGTPLGGYIKYVAVNSEGSELLFNGLAFNCK